MSGASNVHPTAKTPMFKQQLSTGDFVLENRIEAVNKALEYGDGLRAWQNIHILYVNLPKVVHDEVARDFNTAHEKIKNLLGTEPEKTSKAQLQKIFDNGTALHFACMEIIFDILEEINITMDRHNFRWSMKSVTPTNVSNLYGRLNEPGAPIKNNGSGNGHGTS